MGSTQTNTSVRFEEFDATRRYGMIINGESVESESGRAFRCFDPFEEKEWGYVPEASAIDVDRAVRAARAAFAGWSSAAPGFRVEVLRRWAEAIRTNLPELARTQVHENGKTLTEMSGATPGVAAIADYSAQMSLALHGSTVGPAGPGHDAWTLREPLGVVACITPWNNPLVLLSWKLFPALAAGNTVVIKPSEVTPISTIRLIEIGITAGLPRGVVNVVTGAGEAGGALVEHPGVAKIAFTGSTGTGRRISEAAARRFAGVTLELGGKGPQIVFPDADLTRAVPSLHAGIINGTGQACNAGSRILIHTSIYDDVIQRLVTEFEATAMGDPIDPKTQVGPIASRAQYSKIRSYLDIADSESSTELLYGARTGPEVGGGDTGLFIEPTLYTTPDATSRLRCEEIFGPIGSVIRFEDEADALRIANESDFGLVSGVWTQDIDRANRMSRKIEAGVVWINTWRAFSWNVPFGGRKESGVGQELGVNLLAPYTHEKAVWLGRGQQD